MTIAAVDKIPAIMMNSRLGIGECAYSASRTALAEG